MAKLDKKDIQDNFGKTDEAFVDSPFKGVIIEDGVEGTPAELKTVRSK